MLAPTTSEKERAMTDTSKIISSFQSERARARAVTPATTAAVQQRQQTQKVKNG